MPWHRALYGSRMTAMITRDTQITKLKPARMDCLLSELCERRALMSRSRRLAHQSIGQPRSSFPALRPLLGKVSQDHVSTGAADPNERFVNNLGFIHPTGG